MEKSRDQEQRQQDVSIDNSTRKKVACVRNYETKIQTCAKDRRKKWVLDTLLERTLYSLVGINYRSERLLLDGCTVVTFGTAWAYGRGTSLSAQDSFGRHTFGTYKISVQSTSLHKRQFRYKCLRNKSTNEQISVGALWLLNSAFRGWLISQ